MKKVCIALLFCFMGLSHADEVSEGNGVIVLEPKAEPIYVGREGKRKVWKCEGLVNPRLVNAIYKETRLLSMLWQLATPDESTCLYMQTFTAFGGGVRLDVIEFGSEGGFVPQCQLDGACPNQINSRIMSVRGQNVRSYTGLLTKPNGRQSLFGACFAFNGEMRSIEKSCVEL